MRVTDGCECELYFEMERHERAGHTIFWNCVPHGLWKQKYSSHKYLKILNNIQCFTSRKKAAGAQMWQMRVNTCVVLPKYKPLEYQKQCILEKWTTKVSTIKLIYFWSSFDI